MENLKKKTVKEGRAMGRHSEKGKGSMKRSSKEQLLYLILLLLFSLFVVLSEVEGGDKYQGESIPMEDVWMDEDGLSMRLSDLPRGDLALVADLTGQSLENKKLCLRSVDTCFTLFADGEEIYSYHPSLPKILGCSYGIYIHRISIPEGAQSLCLCLYPIFPGTPARLEDVVLTDSDLYMEDLFRNNLLALGRSALILIIGILFLILSVASKYLRNLSGINLVAFGTTCLLLGFSGMNDTYLLQVLTQRPELIRVLTYVCLILVPYPMMCFFAGAVGECRSVLLTVTLLLCLLNFFSTVLLTCFGLTDYYYMVNVTHLVLLLSFAAVIFLVGRAIRRGSVPGELLRVLVVGTAASISGAGIDLVRYHIKAEGSFSGFTRIGVLLFIVLMGIYMFSAQIQLMRKKQEEDRTFIIEITEAFAKVIDMKDRYTKGHSSRVAQYTSMLAEELGYDEETVEKYYRIALLHDIGKVGVPQEVLNKPGKLTDEEYGIIKQHTTMGYEALKGISIMPELAVGAQAHHERPDGKGYPNHLKGDEIPRVAQIIAVADCFDAMYSNRPYRRRMNFDKAVSIIREVSGTQLTGDVVDAFLRLVEKGAFRDPDDDGGGSTENIENIRKGIAG